ncbi:chromate transporter [Anaerosacchariphilus polymeriproducens]|uniref:Chromate transporter n=1 Tax=Anaerosacchariphilus polymeriproducens TaxID=1812858 RepID=A0A371AXI5_9FIRM|nr:chromate transporter [Anaerosacchariphilus polymeriproducens]RDU24296.1 chromate transporter [Anaerosacchariphilus polymeriproducens]
MKRETKKKFDFSLAMLKAGCIGFGGGNAVIPIIEQEFVSEKHLIEKEELNKEVIVASITPGAFSTKIAAGVGKRLFGVTGMLSSAFLMSLPGGIITVLLISVLSRMGTKMSSIIEFASLGITAFIMCLLTDYVRKVVQESQSEYKVRFIKTCIIILAVFLLTGGKNIYHLIGIDKTPIFAVSAIHVLSASFFGIFYTKCRFNLKNTLISILIVTIYFLCVGKAELIKNEYVFLFVQVLMISLSCYGLKDSISKSKKFRIVPWHPFIKTEFICLSLVCIIAIPALVVSMDSAIYLVKGMFSTWISFGGGDAYLTVADGMFVSTQMVSADEFYGRLVSIVNILPGSILCKTLSGIGYYIGFHATGSIFAGYIVAFAGFICSVTGSCAVLSLGYYLYECFEELDVLKLIRRWIRPIVSGLLLNVMISMLNNGMNIGRNLEKNPLFILGIILGIYILNVFLYYKYKFKSGILIIISVTLSLLVSKFI